MRPTVAGSHEDYVLYAHSWAHFICVLYVNVGQCAVVSDAKSAITGSEVVKINWVGERKLKNDMY